jgi:excisionase family DNA binding protein
MDGDELLTLPEIAVELGVNPATVRWWVSTDKLTAQRSGRRWLVRRDDLERFQTDLPHLGRKKDEPETPPDPLPKRFSEISLLSRTKPIRGS